MLFLLKYQEKLSFFRIFRMFSQIRKIKEPVSTCSEVINIEEEQFGSELENRSLEKKIFTCQHCFSHIKSFPLLKKKHFYRFSFFFFRSGSHEDPSDLFILSEEFFPQGKKKITFTNASCGKLFFWFHRWTNLSDNQEIRTRVLFLISFSFFFCHVWNQVLVYLDKQVVEHFSLWWSTSVIQKHNFSWRNLFPRSFTQEK